MNFDRLRDFWLLINSIFIAVLCTVASEFFVWYIFFAFNWRSSRNFSPYLSLTTLHMLSSIHIMIITNIKVTKFVNRCHGLHLFVRFISQLFTVHHYHSLVVHDLTLLIAVMVTYSITFSTSVLILVVKLLISIYSLRIRHFTSILSVIYFLMVLATIAISIQFTSKGWKNKSSGEGIAFYYRECDTLGEWVYWVLIAITSGLIFSVIIGTIIVLILMAYYGVPMVKLVHGFCILLSSNFVVYRRWKEKHTPRIYIGTERRGEI